MTEKRDWGRKNKSLNHENFHFDFLCFCFSQSGFARDVVISVTKWTKKLSIIKLMRTSFLMLFFFLIAHHSLQCPPILVFGIWCTSKLEGDREWANCQQSWKVLRRKYTFKSIWGSKILIYWLKGRSQIRLNR